MKTISVLLIVVAALSCSRSQVVESPTGQPSVPTATQARADTGTNEPIAIESIELFATWRGKRVRIDRWRQTADPNVPHPEVFDVLCSIQNKGDSAVQAGDFIFVTTVDFIVAPTSVYSGDITKVIANHNWSRIVSMDDVKLGEDPYLQSHERGQIAITRFNLGKVIKEFDGTDDTLWPWALRMNVRLLNREMTTVASGQAVLPLIPADNRLAAK